MRAKEQMEARPRRGRLQVAVLVAAALALVAGLAAPASARGQGRPPLMVDGLAGPLSIDVTRSGDVLVGQNFAGVVSKVSKDGAVTDLVAEPGASAVAEGPFGTVLYTVSDPEAGIALLKVRKPWGETKVLADLRAHEEANNPDQGNAYGFESISDQCAEQWPVEEAGPPQYNGIVDSNPYALAVSLWGVYVADAGANAILLVGWDGRIKTVSVLPPQPIVVPDDPGALGLPDCVAGLTYNFEPVPTDIELSWFGGYVSLLPGGPEDPSLGARGSVVKVNLHTGSVKLVASGFFAATDLAVSPWGDVYVTELFGGRVSKVNRWGTQTVAELPEPAAVEYAHGKLYVAYDAFADEASGGGKITTLRP